MHVASWEQVTSTGTIALRTSQLTVWSSRFSRAQDIRGMILGNAERGYTESPGRSRGGRQITDALENHWRTDAELATATRTRADEVACVSHSFLTD